jgi:oligopeptide/dipeptide ABC transporter ATP-binding protein
VTAPLVELRDVSVRYATREGAPIRAVDGVSLAIPEGKTLGLVGESGCGKSTLGRTVIRLTQASAGSIHFEGVDITHLPERELRRFRPRMQPVFQDPFSSLNPLKRVGRIIGEPLEVHGMGDRAEIRRRVAEMLERVGLPVSAADRFPREFSGGQRQRIAIARALALQPRFVVADEPVSALDVSIQAQVINLLERLQEEESLTYLFISHDLGVIRLVADQVAVMYLGRVVELAAAEDLFARPLHPYTEALMSAVPIPDPDSGRPERVVLHGDLPNPADPPTGCYFHTRCRYATEFCSTVDPPLLEHAPGQLAACHYPLLARKATPAGRPAG